MRTSAHVVADGSGRGRASFADGRDLAFEVVGSDPLSDLAVLRAEGGSLSPADLGDAAPLRTSIEKVFSQDATLKAVWREGPTQSARIAQEIGALLAQAEKYRCNECGFSGRNFYWHCPACHSWDTFEAYAIVKLR